MNVKEKASRRFYTKVIPLLPPFPPFLYELSLFPTPEQEQENIANIKQKICDAAIEVEKVLQSILCVK